MSTFISSFLIFISQCSLVEDEKFIVSTVSTRCYNWRIDFHKMIEGAS